MPFVEFDLAMDIEHTGLGEAPLEPIGSGHDGFIASFSIDPISVGVANAGGDTHMGTGWVRATAEPAQWAVVPPGSGEWTYGLHDSAGRLVQVYNGTAGSLLVDLHDLAPGIYCITARSRERAFSTKIARP